MKSKKGIIILSTVVIACAVGFIVSPLVNWSVDSENASGDIAKSSRFARKTAAESLTNMEELIANDEDYKNNISALYVVMQTRALQFASLVDMSNKVAGNIPAFADVLKDMNGAREMVNNVKAQLAEAGSDLTAALAGESRPNLTQNTLNASLAYTTLQKQNKLATRFIETTDKYLESAEGDNQLKFVRDQWLEYQQVTAALEGDEKTAEKLAQKGNLLTGEQTLASMVEFDTVHQVVAEAGAELASQLNIDNTISNAFTEGDAIQTLGDRVVDLMQNSETLIRSVEILGMDVNGTTLNLTDIHQLGSVADLMSAFNTVVAQSQENMTKIGQQESATWLGAQFGDQIDRLGSQGSIDLQVQR